MTKPLQPLVATDLTRRYAHRTVLDGFSLTAPPGQRIGLIGENGSGKSTLLRVLAGVDRPDGGTVSRPDDLVYLSQEPPFADTATVGQVLRETLAPLRGLVERVERLAADDPTSAAYAEALGEAVAKDAWSADRRAEVAAGRLGIDGLGRDRVIGSLSGGQRTRLALCALMTQRPACVLLDEPTNHLDEPAMVLLEELLVSLPGVVVLASHDRVLLDTVCTRIVDLDPSELGPAVHTGSFSEYLRLRDAARRRWEQQYADQQAELHRLREATRIDTGSVAHGRGPTDNDKFIHKFKGANVERTLARRKRQSERALAGAERAQVARPRPRLVFDAELTTPSREGASVVSARDLVVAGRVSVDRLDLKAGERLLVTGPNGSGKSTLLAVLAGTLAPTSGRFAVHAQRAAWLRQDVSFDDEARSALATYDVHNLSGVHLKELGLLRAEQARQPVGALSVGQRRRLGLAIAIAQAPDLLLLDEPTNHLSLALATELEEALDATSGTVVIASHDRWLRRRWSGADLDLAIRGRL